MSWQNYFQNHILERGLIYFIENRVISLDKEEDYLTAKVIGTDMYEVEAVLDKGKVLALDCTCPHAADDNFCKHMAAVMFAYESEHTDTSKSEPTKSVEEVVNQADINYMRKFLIELLTEDSSLFNQFVAGQKTSITQVDLEYLKIELREIFADHLYPTGFIDYNHAWDFSADIEHYMTRIIKVLLIQNGHYKAAFELINIIFLKLVDLPIDDSGGTLTDIAYECYDLWEMILESASPNFQGEMFAWFTNAIEAKDLDFLDDYIEKILFSHFTEESYMKKKIELVKKQLKKFEVDKNSWGYRYEFNKWALYYLKVLEPFESRKEEQLPFILEHLEFNSVREFYVDKLIAAEDFEEAIRILKEGHDSEDRRIYVSDKYHEKLKDLYLKTGKEEDYQKTLYELICKYGSRRMDLYDEFKALFSSEEWIEKRDTLLKELSAWDGKDELLLKEGMVEELLQLALNTPGLGMVQKYEELCCQMDSEKVLDKYEEEILEQAEATTNRKTYRKIAQTIRQMNQLPDSTNRVEELLTYLRTTYKNRPAMMDELTHL